MRKPFSVWSLVLTGLGLLALGIDWAAADIMEPVVLLGLILLLFGISFSFIAFVRREKGVVKVISVAAFFIILFCLVWFEPMTLIYILTWLNIL